MNVEWAISELNKFVELTAAVNGSSDGFITPTSRSVSPRHEVLQQWAKVKGILERVYPNWQNECRIHSNYEFGQRRDAAIHARELIVSGQEIEANLGPSGPSLSSARLHDWIWLPAKQLWSDGYYREAVQASATKLDQELQIRLGRRDITGKELVNQAFSSNPATSEKPRFAFVGQLNEQSDRSFFDGMRSLGEACFLLARNLTSHQLKHLEEHEALELLAILSYFARQVDQAQIVRS